MLFRFNWSCLGLNLGPSVHQACAVSQSYASSSDCLPFYLDLEQGRGLEWHIPLPHFVAAFSLPGKACRLPPAPLLLCITTMNNWWLKAKTWEVKSCPQPWWQQLAERGGWESSCFHRWVFFHLFCQWHCLHFQNRLERDAMGFSTKLRMMRWLGFFLSLAWPS